MIAIVSAALIKNNAGRLLNTAGVENTSLQAADIISYAFLSVNLFTNLMLTGLIGTFTSYLNFEGEYEDMIQLEESGG